MPKVVFSPAMKRHVDCPPAEATGHTVREVLDAAFERHQAARRYVLDDQAEVRKHIAIFVDGRRLRDRITLSDPVSAKSEILIAPALSGG